MSDEHETNPSPDPEQDARVRALLADLGSTHDPGASLPPEVADRLDETLAGLVAERASAAGAAPADTSPDVVPLRRRWAARAGAAAAAVIVLGVGGLAVANLGNDDMGSSDSAAGGSQAEAQDSTRDSGDSATAGQPGSSDQPSTSLLPRDVPALTAGAFDAQVTRLVRSGGVATPPQPLSSERKSAGREEQGDQGGVAAAGGCPGPATDEGATRSTVTYDGSPAALVVHPARGGDRLVEAWTCTGEELLDSAQVPVETPGHSSPGSPGSDSTTPSP